MYSVYFLAIITILGLFNVPLGGVLATASVLGVAVGFGAQSLVKDVITGFFIIFENQFAVGEHITTLGVTGQVEEMGLRLTKVRDAGGQLHILPNGQIGQVTNYNRGSMRATVDLHMDYQDDLHENLKLLDQVCQEVSVDLADIITEKPRVLGIHSFNANDMIIRITAQVKPMEQGMMERELRRRISAAYQQLGREVPYGGVKTDGQL